MSENAVLALENVGIFTPGRSVVRIVVRPVRPGQVTQLSDPEPPVADLFIRQPGNDHLRVRIHVSSDDIVSNGRAVIQSLVLAYRGGHRALACWDRGGRPLGGRHGSARFFLLLPLHLLLLFVRHPRVGALEHLSITRLGHHQIVDPLLGSVRLRRLKRYMISLVARHRLHLDFFAVQIAVRTELSSLVDERLSSGGHLALHETPVAVRRFQRWIVSDHVDVSDRVLVQERQIAALRVCAGMHDHGSFEAVIPVGICQTRAEYLPLSARNRCLLRLGYAPRRELIDGCRSSHNY